MGYSAVIRVCDPGQRRGEWIAHGLAFRPDDPGFRNASVHRPQRFSKYHECFRWGPLANRPGPALAVQGLFGRTSHSEYGVTRRRDWEKCVLGNLRGE